MKIRAFEASPCVLAFLFFVPAVQGACPAACWCSGNDRNVDCSGRNLSALPLGLQENITSLNLSYNRLTDLNYQLTTFANLRTLDLSHNGLASLPAQLPRSLWEIYASHNHIKILQKLDTAYQWNLKVLDVSDNAVERVVFINNTMSSLKALNLSSNKLWTVPTNIPSNMETVDLSNNFLTQILPGTLVRLTRLSKLYLHNNKFAYIPDGTFDQLIQLQLITLYNNPWACEDSGEQPLAYLQEWVSETKAVVLGRPCSDEAATLWKGATLGSPAPTTAENHLFVKAMKAGHTAGPPGTTEPTKHVRPQFRMKDIHPGATGGQTVAFPSTDRPLVLYPEELSTEEPEWYEAAAAPHTIYMQDTTSGKLSTRGVAGSPTTPLTLSITSGVPTNYSKRPQSTTTRTTTTTTTTVKKEELTTKMNPRPPSEANIRKGDLYLIATLAVVALATGYGLVLK